jgi:hypothetical protein
LLVCRKTLKHLRRPLRLRIQRLPLAYQLARSCLILEKNRQRLSYNYLF